MPNKYRFNSEAKIHPGVKMGGTLSLRKKNTQASDKSIPNPSLDVSSTTTEQVEKAAPEHVTSLVAAENESEAVQLHVFTPLTDWQICGDSVVGLAHRRKGLPCQDAVAFRHSPRPILALSDGAGSASISERGAQALVTGVPRLLQTLEDDLALLLDSDESSSQETLTRWAERLRLHARGLLNDLAQAERRDVRDVRATLQIIVIGKRSTFWWKVGDGEVVVKSRNGLKTLGSSTKAQNEFANQTCFADAAEMNDLQFGLLLTQDIFGIAMMSDGGAEKLVSTDGSKVASRLEVWLDELAEQRFSIERIALEFHERTMWERTSLDDRSLLLASRKGI